MNKKEKNEGEKKKNMSMPGWYIFMHSVFDEKRREEKKNIDIYNRL